jgi:hypothetical protein
LDSIPARLTIGVLLAATAFAPMAAAQQPTKAAPTATPASQPPVVMPGPELIVMLVRMSVLTLNDAVHTGNYTVLRDVGAPAFRDANSAAGLAQAFTPLANSHVDLSAVAMIAPQLSEPPALDQTNRMLRLKGTFPGEPVRIDFDLTYQAVNGVWQLFGLSVNPAMAVSGVPASQAQPATPGAAKKESGKKQ